MRPGRILLLLIKSGTLGGILCTRLIKAALMMHTITIFMLSEGALVNFVYSNETGHPRYLGRLDNTGSDRLINQWVGPFKPVYAATHCHNNRQYHG